MKKLKDYIVEVAYSEPDFPLIESLAKIKECVYFDSTSGYLRDGIGKFTMISEEKLRKSLLKAKMEAYLKASEKGRKNLKQLEEKGRNLFEIREIYKTVKCSEFLENEKIWFLANISSFSLPFNVDWLKEIYLVKDANPFNLYVRCSCKASFDSLSSELLKIFGSPLEREFVIVFSTFKKI